MAELYPLSKKEFETLYDKAWKNGWVYGRYFQELYDEYLVNWVCFVDYLDVLKGASKKSRMYARVHDKFVIVIAENQQPILIEAEDHYGSHIDNHKKLTAIEILIGEAPPFWKGNAKNKDKSYFYNPSQTKSSKWLNAPADWKSTTGKFIPKATALKYIKIEKLAFLASENLILFDVFPFPIIQDTKIRQAVSGKFPEHIEEYFIPKLESIIKYIQVKKTNIKYGFVATTYGSLHLLFGDKTREIFKGFDLDFYTKGIVEGVSPIELVYQGKLLNKQLVAFNDTTPIVLFKTIYKLICPAEDNPDKKLKGIVTKDKFDNDNYVVQIKSILENNRIPILMDGSGNVNFTKFFNSKNNPSYLEEEENLKKNQEEED